MDPQNLHLAKLQNPFLFRNATNHWCRLINLFPEKTMISVEPASIGSCAVFSRIV